MEGNRDGAGSRRSRPVLLLLVCACAAAAGAVYWHWSPGLQPARAVPASRPAVPVKIAVAARQDVPIIVTGLGTVQASFTIAIHTQVEGIMQQVLFTEGQHVKKGDLLARIDPRLYQAALDQAKAKKSQDTATLIGAEKDLVRSKTLVVRNVATEQTVDQQQARVDQLKASIEADQAAIETAQTQFDYTFIKAPSDGRIGVRLVDPGNLVHASDTRRDRQPGADAALRRDVHPADAGARRSARGYGARAGRGAGLRPKRPPAAEHRQAASHRQCHRPGDRDHSAQGDVRQ